MYEITVQKPQSTHHTHRENCSLFPLYFARFDDRITRSNTIFNVVFTGGVAWDHHSHFAALNDLLLLLPDAVQNWLTNKTPNKPADNLAQQRTSWAARRKKKTFCVTKRLNLMWLLFSVFSVLRHHYYILEREQGNVIHQTAVSEGLFTTSNRTPFALVLVVACCRGLSFRIETIFFPRNGFP